MKTLLTILFSLQLLSGFATTFTEFYVQLTGNNLNSGSTPDNSATFSATGGFFTNNTSASSCTWVKSGASLSAVTNGAWASIYPDAATTNVFTGLVTAVDDTADTITVSLTAKAGAVPNSDTTGATSIRVGGAWRGPNTNNISLYDNSFPFPFAGATLTNSSGNVPCINFKAGVYGITNAITQASNGPIRFQGYTTSVRDGGLAVFDASGIAAGFTMITLNGINVDFFNFQMQNSGTTGNGEALRTGATKQMIAGCVASNILRNGFYSLSAGDTFSECRAISCSKNNSGNEGGFSGQGIYINCISGPNTAANNIGFYSATLGTAYINCVAYSNGSHGFSTSGALLQGCDAYGNTGCGINLLTMNEPVTIRNCNLFANSDNGITAVSASRTGWIVNCAFGSGTMTNANGSLDATMTGVQSGVLETGSIVYGASDTPWANAPAGNFSIKATATTKSAGRGTFTASSTVAYPDIGAGQSASTNIAAGASGGSYIFAQ